MVRKVVAGMSALAVTLMAVLVTATAASAATTFPLDLSQSTAFSVLGYSCGGIAEQSYVTGFDPASGYPVGDVYLSTTCNGSGRGGHSSTHTAWAGVTWDFTATVVSDTLLSSAPTVDPLSRPPMPTATRSTTAPTTPTWSTGPGSPPRPGSPVSRPPRVRRPAGPA